MARKSTIQTLDTQFAFYAQLWEFYCHNRGKIRSRYNGLTKKLLDYNDKTENPNAFLRTPQFEALEMYVFIKEFSDNAQVYELFDEWRKHTGHFDETSYYAVDSKGQLDLFRASSEPVLDALFEQMKQYKEDYPNYIYALTMGLGKTVLMATCIFYEFLLANKYPKDERFCHNALVFAPDKTVLHSLLEIQTFDKSKVIPPEYVHVLDQNITFHYMDEATVLSILEDSEFNIIISNTQKIIVKKKHKDETPAEQLFNANLLSDLYGDEDDDIHDDASLIENMRFKRLCRLNQLGVYVDEAHHLFGADLEKQIRAGSADKTSLRNTINKLAKETKIVACYNYTGTPYVGGRHLPEVVYAYGLKESIDRGYLKNADPHGYTNVKSEEFLKDVIKLFWNRYGNKTYDGLNPKLAIYASRIDEAANVVKPFVEEVLAELGIHMDRILLYVGDSKYTKEEDQKFFEQLDIVGSQGNEKQFIILVEKGKEGWNCHSLFGVAMFRKPSSTVFVLQATMRCLRAITNQRQTASIYLSDENLQILDDELNKNFNIRVDDLKGASNAHGHTYHVHVLLPNEKIQLKRIRHKHSFALKENIQPVDFDLSNLNLDEYNSTRTIRHGLAEGARSITEIINDVKDNYHYSELTLTGEIARYLNITCIKANEILRTSKDGVEAVLEKVNFDNKILYDIIIPKIVQAMFEFKTEIITETRELTLLHKPVGQDFYLFNGKDGLVATDKDKWLEAKLLEKSFHADTYCFDSSPEMECFKQYLHSNKVKKIYFTGMFTSPNQSDFSIPYLNPESNCIRHYYPDFLAEMEDGSYQIVEVKGDDKIDDKVVQAKTKAATEMAGASQMEYRMLAGSVIMKSNVIDDANTEQLLLPNS